MTALNPQEIPPIPTDFIGALDQLDQLQHTDTQKTAEFKLYSSVSQEQPQEQTERLPKEGDELIYTGEINEPFFVGQRVFVSKNNKVSFTIRTNHSTEWVYPYGVWREYFRFADEQTERLPKVGDELIAICETDEFLTKGEPYSVLTFSALASSNNPQDVTFVIKDDRGNSRGFSFATWRKYFRFADEPTPEDLASLHSYLHVNGGAKKPYRIKTRQEMIDGGAVVANVSGDLKIDEEHYFFSRPMTYLHGRELENNGRQRIDDYTIEPWMITENN